MSNPRPSDMNYPNFCLICNKRLWGIRRFGARTCGSRCRKRLSRLSHLPAAGEPRLVLRCGPPRKLPFSSPTPPGGVLGGVDVLLV